MQQQMAPLVRCSVAVALLAAPAAAHSWVACTDYRGSPNYFEQDRCFGWPRRWDNRNGATAPTANGYQIAADTGRDFQPGGGSACDIPMSTPSFAAGYSAEFPHAVYEQGRVYCLAWPMKNHAAASCTNSFIPDTSLTLMVSSVDPASDPTQAEFNPRNINELAGFATNCDPTAPGSNDKTDGCQLGLEKHASGQQDCKGFQRSPRFCDSTGDSMGTGCFKVPEDLASGHYVGQWFWEFNPGAFYISCFDFVAVAPGAPQATPGTPGTAGQADTEFLPCVNNYFRLTGQAPPAQPAPAPTAPLPQAPAPPPTPVPAPTSAPQAAPAPNSTESGWVGLSSGSSGRLALAGGWPVAAMGLACFPPLAAW